MPRCNVWSIVLLVGLTGCGTSIADPNALCLKEHPGNARCCWEGYHLDNGICCADGQHQLSDVERPDWKICVLDEDPPAHAGACPDAGADAP